MQTNRRDAFTTIRTDGGLLPADLLVRIAEGDRSIDGLTPESYHLAKSERLNEAATRAWNRLQGAWEGFRGGMDRLPESDAGTTLTRERWLLILFQELGYGRLQTARAVEIDGKSYPISHVWQATPIHLVSFRQELDRRTPGARGASRVSPHSLVQELLSRSDDHLWGFVSNGLRLRLLRDNASLTRAACVEFDLQSMMEGEVYSDFFLLFLLCHQSRVEVPEGKTVEHCWLERWYNTSLREGTRVLDRLRDGVEQAIEALGGGFLSHPANTALRDKLRAGTLATQDYYRQVLRVVYRLLFLFVAEDRDLLLLPAGEDARLAAARDLYIRYYSTQRLRRLAERRRSARHADLYRALRLVFAKLHSGCPELALPALGSYLFAPTSTPDLNDADIANADLLAAVWNLTFTADGNVRRSVDYRNLGPEELGSVYESLLEMHPDVHLEAGKFKLRVAAGSERKTTGSYYTPTSLVNCLLDSALEPVLDEACKKPDAEQALLDLKVCDPACGSGHFLIAAAHRIAKRLAAIRAGEDEPAPKSIQHALRDVVSRCIYGVDINPMAVELCKINLWMEALEPGRPLTFLDHHIRAGNSLLGTTPALMKRGIPDDAFKPLEGDDRAVCSELKRRNRDERRGQGLLPFGQPQWLKLGNLVQSFANLTAEDDSTPEALAAKEQHFVELVCSTAYENARMLADAWCAAFVCEKRRNSPLEITEAVFRRWEDNPHHITLAEKEELLRLRDQYNFFHWHLAFPEVFKPKPTDQIGEAELTGWAGGFDCVLGNPPWEMLETNEHSTAAEQVVIHRSQHLVSGTGRYPLTGSGRRNLYALFAETGLGVLARHGRAGLVLPTGIVTDKPCERFCEYVLKNNRLVNVFDFENQGRFFEAVHRQQRFCLLTVLGSASTDEAPRIGCMLDEVSDTTGERVWELATGDLLALCDTRFSIPLFRNPRDARIASRCYASGSTIAALGAGKGPRVLSGLCFNFDDRSRSLKVSAEEAADGDNSAWCPVYEGEYFHHFDHRFATFAAGSAVCNASVEDKRNASFTIQTATVIRPTDCQARWREMWKSPQWYVALRRQASVTNETTSIAAVLPFSAAEGSVSCFFGDDLDAPIALWLCASLNSFAFNYLVRLRQGGSNLSKSVYEQIPLPPFDDVQGSLRGSGLGSLARRCALELLYTGWDLRHFAADCGYDGPPFVWDHARRQDLRSELEAALFHSYGIGRDDVAYIMETFPILQRREEQAHGSYRMRDAILETYNRMSAVIQKNEAAVAAGQRPTARYQTALNPPPGPPTDAAGNFIPMVQWDRANWPAHIHQPRPAAVPAVAAEQVQIGRAVAYLNLLLHTWGKPVVRDALEAGLVFMLNDSIRQRVLRGTRPTQPAPAGRGHFLSGMDAVLSNMKANGAIDTRTETGRMVVSAGRQAVTVANAPAADVAKAKEAIQAVQRLGESRTAAEYAGVFDVEYALV